MARWSRRRGSYHEWSLYPEPLYRAGYINTAKSDGEVLTPTDYCKHYLSEYLRGQPRMDEDLATPWMGRAEELPDGSHAYAIGAHVIAGSGIRVVVDDEGNLVEFEHLFSEE